MSAKKKEINQSFMVSGIPCNGLRLPKNIVVCEKVKGKLIPRTPIGYVITFEQEFPYLIEKGLLVKRKANSYTVNLDFTFDKTKHKRRVYEHRRKVWPARLKNNDRKRNRRSKRKS